MTLPTVRERLVMDLNSDIEAHQETLERFKRALDQDATYALEWSERTFFAAARKKACEYVVQCLEQNSVTDVADHITKVVLDLARNPGRSTSKASNLMNEHLAEAYAAMAQKLNDYRVRCEKEEGPKRNRIEIFWSDEDEGYIAVATDLPGCSAIGVTQFEALAQLRDAMEAWHQAAEAAGNVKPLTEGEVK